MVMRHEKMKANYLKKYVREYFFSKLAPWRSATSLQMNFFTEMFRDFH